MNKEQAIKYLKEVFQNNILLEFETNTLLDDNGMIRLKLDDLTPVQVQQVIEFETTIGVLSHFFKRKELVKPLFEMNDNFEGENDE